MTPVNDERFVRECLQGQSLVQACAPGENVRVRKGQHHRLLQQQIDDKPFLIGDHRADERGVDPFIAQIIDEIRCPAFLQRQRHKRESIPIRANDARDEGMEGGRTREILLKFSLARRALCVWSSRTHDRCGTNRASVGEQRRAGVG